jgi:hypothetical protein
MLPRLSRCASGALLATLILGCGTTRMTDTPRAATEMLLVSQAVDKAVAQIDFAPLAGKTVFLESAAIDKDVVDKGYVVSLIRQELLAAGALLQEEKTRAEFVVDIRTGAIGTDRHSLLVGTPAVSLPSVVPGLPTNIPEIALVKKNDQRGVAKIAVVAYNRISGRAAWQSGSVESTSRANDLWVFGAGPFSRGTIRRRTELAGEPLPSLTATFFGDHRDLEPRPHDIASEHVFPLDTSPPPAAPIPAGFLGITGAAALSNKQLVR